jgi:hypothetical protein
MRWLKEEWGGNRRGCLDQDEVVVVSMDEQRMYEQRM